MKRRKIILIYSRSYNAYSPPPDSDHYFLAGWTATIATYLLKYTDKYHVENWRAEKEVKKIETREIDPSAIDDKYYEQTPASHEKVKCRLFPAFSIGGKLFSPLLLQALRKEAKQNEILVHHTMTHTYEMYLHAYFLKNFPFVAQHQGSAPPIFKAKEIGSISKLKKINYYFKSLAEKQAMRYIDFYLAGARGELEYMSNISDPKKVILYHRGVDFNNIRYVPKTEARKILNLPQDKKIMVYVGKYYKVKGVDIILKAFEKLKKKYDVELILIGGSKKDPLYDDAVASGAIVMGRVDRDTELPIYYSAADVYLLPTFIKETILWDGIGMASLEALACNTPVVGKNLIHFAEVKDINRIGLIPKDKNDVINCVEKIFDNPSRYKNCREIVKRYYDRKNTIWRIINIYDYLFERYYK